MIYKGNTELENLFKGDVEVENVWLGTKEVWTNSLGSLVDLGVGTSFNVRNVLPNDYQNLTADNFFIYSLTGTNGGSGSTSSAMVNVGSSESTLVKSYNASIGILTCCNKMEANWRDSDQTQYSNKNTSCGVKVFVPKKRIANSQKVNKMIYLGEGQSFDVSQVYSDYRKLTADNFYIKSYKRISYSEGTGAGGSVSVWLSLSLAKSYNTNTGALTISCHSDIFGKVANSNVQCWLLRTK